MIDKRVLDDIADEPFRQICEKVVDGLNRLPIPGAVVGIAHGDQELIAGFGVTSVDHPLAVTGATLFQIGSITKTYLATLVMRLVELGKLELDAPIRTYLPDLKLADETVAARATMRHLLTHTGGWEGDYFDDFGIGDDALAKMVAKMAGLPQLMPLGQVWSYNNSGFYLAGRVIEVVTGKPFESAMKELLFDPLGLTMSFFFAHDAITHRFAVGHEVVDKQPKVARPWALGRAIHPAGGIVCSAGDVLRYARFHMGDGAAADGTRLLAPESLAAMHTPLFPSTGLSMMGLGWGVSTVGDTKMLGHGGGTHGQITLLRVVPLEQFAVAIFTNSDQGGILAFEIMNDATKQYLGIAPPEDTPLDLPEEQLQPYQGRYDAAGGVCDISLRDGGLVLQLTPKGGFPTPDSPPAPAPPPVRVAFYAEDRVIVLDQPMKDARAEFLRDSDQGVAWLRFGGRVHTRQA